MYFEIRNSLLTRNCMRKLYTDHYTILIYVNPYTPVYLSVYTMYKAHYTPLYSTFLAVSSSQTKPQIILRRGILHLLYILITHAKKSFHRITILVLYVSFHPISPVKLLRKGPC